jgi:hypothetical protein
MSTLATNAITDASGGNTATINSYTPTESNMAGRNRIINGDMRIDQRNAGASVTPSSSAYTLDRWRVGKSSPAVMSFQQVADAPAGFTHSLLSTVVTSAATTSSALLYLQQNIEGFNVSDFGFGTANAQPITASFWVKSNLTGLKSFSFINGALNRAYSTTYNIISANTWEYKTITVPGDTTGTWNTNNGVGIELHFNFAVGSTYQTTLGSWSSGRTYTDATTPQFATTAGATINITGVQLEAGSVATPFERRQYGQELALCQRYCQVYGSGNGYERLGMAMGVTSISVNVNIYLPVTMRATPSVSSTGSWAWYNGSSVVAGTTFTLDALSTQVVALILATTGATSGSTYQVINNNDPSARLTLNSEL